MDIAEFLKARLEEDEAAALAAPGENWRAFTEADVAGASVYDEQWVLLYPQRYDHDNPLSAEPGATGPQYIQRSRDALAAHIARHDPARVLREVEAKRAILKWHPREPMRNIVASRCPPCELTWPCPTVRVIAAIYSDHPDYRPDWGP